MSRWFLGTHPKTAAKARKHCKDAQLVSSGEARDGKICILSYYKRSTRSENLIRFPEHDWIAIAGTIIYNKLMGSRALEAIYDDFRQKGLHHIRSNSIGHYAICIKTGSTIHIFGDPEGSFNLFYSFDNGVFTSSNSLSLIGQSLNDAQPLCDNILYYSLHDPPGRQTQFKNVYRLLGNQIVSITNTSSGTSPRIAIDQIVDISSESASFGDYNSIDDFVNLYTAYVVDYFNQIPHSVSSTVHMTGGLDSRTVLAALLSVGHTPSLASFMGNSALTKHRAQD